MDENALGAELLSRHAAALAACGRHGEAVAAWEQVNALLPANPAAVSGLASALLAAGRHRDAMDWLMNANQLLTGHPTLLRLLAQSMLALGMQDEAIGALYVALEAEPESAGTHAAIGIALFRQGQVETALGHCQKAYRLAPNAHNAATLTCVLMDVGRHGDALELADYTLGHGHSCHELLLNRSMALHALGHRPESIAAARDTVAAHPDSAVAKHHLAAALLGAGELTEEAWSLYEARFGLWGAPIQPGQFRRWQPGDDIRGKTVLLHAEQGFGDTIQFARYAKRVAGLGARVLLAVQKPLVRLLDGLEGTSLVFAADGSLPEFDLYSPLLSVPGLLKTTLASIPPPVRLPYPLPSVGPNSEGALRVGLVWAGSSTFIANRKRSLAPSDLPPLAGLNGVQ